MTQKRVGVIDRVDGAVRADRRRGICFAGGGGEQYAGRQGVRDEGPAIDVSILAIDDCAFIDLVDSGRIDAPLANARLAGVLGRSEHRDDLLHHQDTGDDGIGFGRVWVEHRDLVQARSADCRIGVVVVLGEDQVRGGAAIRGDQLGREEACGIVPTEGAGDLGNRERAVVVQEPAPIVVRARPTVLQYAEVDISVGPYGR